MAKKKPGEDRMMFCRRLPVGLVERLRRYVETITPRTTDTAVLEAALLEYLDRHEPKPGK